MVLHQPLISLYIDCNTGAKCHNKYSLVFLALDKCILKNTVEVSRTENLPIPVALMPFKEKEGGVDAFTPNQNISIYNGKGTDELFLYLYNIH